MHRPPSGSSFLAVGGGLLFFVSIPTSIRKVRRSATSAPQTLDKTSTSDLFSAAQLAGYAAAILSLNAYAMHQDKMMKAGVGARWV
jgi:hypothetical protein